MILTERERIIVLKTYAIVTPLQERVTTILLILGIQEIAKLFQWFSSNSVDWKIIISPQKLTEYLRLKCVHSMLKKLFRIWAGQHTPINLSFTESFKFAKTLFYNVQWTYCATVCVVSLGLLWTSSTSVCNAPFSLSNYWIQALKIFNTRLLLASVTSPKKRNVCHWRFYSFNCRRNSTAHNHFCLCSCTCQHSSHIWVE